ncbi:MAG: 50S ribosomal protein L3 [Candidatus Omnitrophica bacterium]|nr:50S ribosomal protein L3 [Candidatus Omnitrophota bacterium]
MIKEIIGKKIGMTQIFDQKGELIGVSVVEVQPVCLLEKVDYLTKKRVKIGCFKVNERKVKKPQLGYFNKLGVGCYEIIKEVPYETNQELPLKKEIGVEIFQEGELVDVTANTKGRGFQGGVKRHNWRGQPRSHGSMTHRRIGSAGASTYPGRIVKGHRMPGHMGNKKCTIKNLEIIKVDKENNLLLIKGSLPGGINSIISIKKAKK